MSTHPASTPHRITEGSEPKHRQLRAVLAGLAAGGLAPDATIPSERELVHAYAVSRATVRRAIESLVAEGVLRRVPGKGTFVAGPRVPSPRHLASFTQDMRRRGRMPSSRVVRVAATTPPPEAASWLGLGAGQPAWRVERVRLADGEPVAFEAGWYSPLLLPDLDRHDLGGSLHELLEHVYGLVVDTAEQTVRAEAAGAAPAHHLGIRPGDPVLAVDRSSRCGGTPLDRVLTHFRGDRYELHLSLDGAAAEGATEHHEEDGP